MVTSSEHLSRWDRRVARTREAIERAALELFEAQGFAATTVEQIAERADVAPRTFFRYFPTKESVLFAGTEVNRQASLERLRARPRDEHPLVSMMAEVHHFAERIADDEHLELQWRIAAEEPSVASHERYVLETTASAELAEFVADRLGVECEADPRPQVWAMLVMSTLRVGLHTWLRSGRRGTVAEHVDRAFAAARLAVPFL